MHSEQEQKENSTPTEWVEGEALGIKLPPGARALRLSYRVETGLLPSSLEDTSRKKPGSKPSTKDQRSVVRRTRPPISGTTSTSDPFRESVESDNTGQKYTIFGINREIVDFLCGEDYWAYAFPGEEKPRLKLQLHMALDPRDVNKQIRKSVYLLESLWYADQGLGMYPFLRTLLDFEFDRVFHPDHREHVCHQLKVFLLGLYLYSGSSHIRKAIAGEIGCSPSDADRKFLRCWRATAAFHDLGYVLETQEALDTPHFPGSVYKELKTIFENPLCAYFNRDHKRLMLPEEERDLQLQAEVTRHDAPKSLTQLEKYKPQEESLLKSLDELVKEAKLAREDNTLSQYYYYAQRAKPLGQSNRPRFIDHGITSALFLLHLHRYYCEYTSKILPYAIGKKSPISSEDVREGIRKLESELRAAEKPVRHAAAAIALHNVRKIWDYGNAREAGLTLTDYRLSLEKNPLAFLLVLSDTLQDWDRPKCSPLSEGRPDSPLLTDQHLTIEARGQAVALLFRKDWMGDFEIRPGHLLSRYNTMLNELKNADILNKDDVDLLLKPWS